MFVEALCMTRCWIFLWVYMGFGWVGEYFWQFGVKSVGFSCWLTHRIEHSTQYILFIAINGPRQWHITPLTFLANFFADPLTQGFRDLVVLRSKSIKTWDGIHLMVVEGWSVELYFLAESDRWIRLIWDYLEEQGLLSKIIRATFW